jgi:hypothetical protein
MAMLPAWLLYAYPSLASYMLSEIREEIQAFRSDDPTVGRQGVFGNKATEARLCDEPRLLHRILLRLSDDSCASKW